MFKKPFKVKSNSQLKGSDRKKLRNEILLNFSTLSEETINFIFPSKEPVFMVKLMTHSGQLVILYCVDKLPVFFHIEEVMYPTVFTLWHIPDLLYTFTTHRQVFSAIAGGADLMLPGVIRKGTLNMHSYGKLNKGDRVAVNLSDNKAPIAVGVAALSSFDMAARHGKCVQIFHFNGDHLCKYGTKLQIPELGPVFSTNDDSQQPSATEDNKVSDAPEKRISDGIERLQLKDECESNIPEEVNESVMCDENEDDEKENIERSDGGDKEDSLASVMPAKEMDDLITYCFLKALKTSVKMVELPILVSNFYKVHMIPACPPFLSIDLKKSTYKKLTNFLDDMVKKNVITLQTITKGVQSVSRVDYNNILLEDFVDKYVSKEELTKDSVCDKTCSKRGGPEIVEQFTVTAAVLPLFEKYLYK